MRLRSGLRQCGAVLHSHGRRPFGYAQGRLCPWGLRPSDRSLSSPELKITPATRTSRAGGPRWPGASPGPRLARPENSDPGLCFPPFAALRMGHPSCSTQANRRRDTLPVGTQREVSTDPSPAANSSATNSATVMLNGQRAALGISPRSMRRSVFQCEMPANTATTSPPRTRHSPKRIAS